MNLYLTKYSRACLLKVFTPQLQCMVKAEMPELNLIQEVQLPLTYYAQIS